MTTNNEEVVLKSGRDSQKSFRSHTTARLNQQHEQDANDASQDWRGLGTMVKTKINIDKLFYMHMALLLEVPD